MFKKITVTLAITALLAGCTLLGTGVSVEKDEILHSKRVTYKTAFWDDERNEQPYSQDLTFLKEIDRNNRTLHTLYDVIILPIESFDLKNEIFIIIDKEILELPTKIVNNYHSKKVNKDTKEIMAVDSTKRTIVTGYDVINKKTIQMTHELNYELVKKISGAETVCLRYYVGPNKINTEIKGSRLKSLREWIRR